MSKKTTHVKTPKPIDVPTFKINVEGSPLPETWNIVSVVVQKEINRIPSAKILLYDGDPSKQTFAASEKGPLDPGQAIEIEAGYHGDNKPIFKGTLVSQKIKAGVGRPSQLCVVARDDVFKMTLTEKTAFFQKKKDSEIAQELIGNYGGLSASVKATTAKHESMLQQAATDWEFLLERAEANGMLVVVDDGKVSIGQEKFSGQPALSLTYGSDIINVEAEVDSRYQAKGVEAETWDYSAQKVVKETATKPSLNSHGDLEPDTLATKGADGETHKLRLTGKAAEGELKAWADGKLKQSRMANIRGRASCQGTVSITPATLLGLAGLGKHFEGNAFVTAVRHEISGADWMTHIQFGLDYDALFKKRKGALATQTLVPGIQGLQVGTVMKIAEDPEGEDRLQIHLPLLDPEKKGIWARVACLDAGKKRGTFFRPETNDEVIVGFLDGDPRHAVILGMLHSSKLPAPIQPADETNPVKGYYSREDMRLLFDDEKKIISLTTPAGHEVHLDEDQKAITLKDQNGNEFTMNDKGIVLKSIKDITIGADDKIEIQAAKDISVKTDAGLTATVAKACEVKVTGDLKMSGKTVAATAQTDYKAEGLNLALAAKAQFKAEGKAGVEVSSPAITAVKGSLVQLN